MSTLYGLDIELPEIHDGELVTDVITIVRTVDPDRPGWDGIYVGCTSHTGGIVQLGLLSAVLDRVGGSWDDEDDDE